MNNDLAVVYISLVVLRLPDFWSNWNLELLVFEEGRKPEYRRKPSRGKGENRQAKRAR